MPKRKTNRHLKNRARKYYLRRVRVAALQHFAPRWNVSLYCRYGSGDTEERTNPLSVVLKDNAIRTSEMLARRDWFHGQFNSCIARLDLELVSKNNENEYHDRETITFYPLEWKLIHGVADCLTPFHTKASFAHCFGLTILNIINEYVFGNREDEWIEETKEGVAGLGEFHYWQQHVSCLKPHIETAEKTVLWKRSRQYRYRSMVIFSCLDKPEWQLQRYHRARKSRKQDMRELAAAIGATDEEEQLLQCLLVNPCYLSKGSIHDKFVEEILIQKLRYEGIYTSSELVKLHQEIAFTEKKDLFRAIGGS